MTPIVAIIQARMGSTRLPGKVLMPLAGRPMLARVVERLRAAKTVDAVVVATTTAPRDGAIEELCRREGWACFRGSEGDVLDRYRAAATAHGAAVVVRVTSDCPLLSPAVVDEVVGALPGFDYASNTLPPRTFPRGLDVEALRMEALQRAWAEDQNPAWREHVTPFLYRHPERFRLRAVTRAPDLSAHRWTVDTPEDYAFASAVYAHFADASFDWPDVLAFLSRHPDVARLNQGGVQKEVG